MAVPKLKTLIKEFTSSAGAGKALTRRKEAKAKVSTTKTAKAIFGLSFGAKATKIE